MTKTRKLASFKYSKPPFYYYKSFPLRPMAVPPRPITVSTVLMPRPSWALVRPGMHPTPYRLAEPFPGIATYTPPPTIFHRKVVKKKKPFVTTENNFVKVDISTTSPSSTTTSKYDLEPFYIHEAIQPLNSTSIATEASHNMELFYIHEAFNNNDTDSTENITKNESTIDKITASYIWHPLEIFEDNMNKTKTQDNSTTDYMVQPRKMLDYGGTSGSQHLGKGHYITRKPKVAFASATIPLTYYDQVN